MEYFLLATAIGAVIGGGINLAINSMNMDATAKAQAEARALNAQERNDNLIQKAKDDATAQKTQDLNMWLTQQKRSDDMKQHQEDLSLYHEKAQQNVLSGLASAPDAAMKSNFEYKKNLLSGLV